MASDDSEFTRRWKRFILTPAVFGEIVKDLLPPGSKVVGLYHDSTVNAITVYAENERFPATAFGNDLPIEMLKVKLADVRRN